MRWLAVSLIAACTLAGAAFASEPAAAPAKPSEPKSDAVVVVTAPAAAPEEAQKPKKERTRVCTTVPETGSLVRKRKVCREVGGVLDTSSDGDRILRNLERDFGNPPLPSGGG